MRYTGIRDAGVLCLTAGVAVICAWPLSTGRNGYVHRLVYLAATFVGAVGILLLLAWGCLSGASAWRGRRERPRRGFEVIAPAPDERQESAQQIGASARPDRKGGIS